MSQDLFRKLAEEFNRTAQSYAKGEASAGVLAAKYSLLLEHKAETGADRKALAVTLLNAGLERFRAVAAPKFGLDGNTCDQHIKPVLARLGEPATIELLPPGADLLVADTGLDVLRCAEQRGCRYLPHDTLLVDLADGLRRLAGKIRTAHGAEAPRPDMKKDDALSL